MNSGPPVARKAMLKLGTLPKLHELGITIPVDPTAPLVLMFSTILPAGELSSRSMKDGSRSSLGGCPQQDVQTPTHALLCLAGAGEQDVVGVACFVLKDPLAAIFLADKWQKKQTWRIALAA